MPRPKKQAEQKRAHIVSFRLNDSEHARLAQNAQRAALDISDYARLSVLQTPIIVHQTTTPDMETVDQLRRIGVNFNQIARAFHRTGQTPPDYFQALCHDVETVLGKVFSEYLERGSTYR